MAEYEFNPSLKELKSKLYGIFLVVVSFIITLIYNRSVHYPTLGNKFDGFLVFVPTILILSVFYLLANRLNIIKWNGQDRWYSLLIFILLPIYFSFVLSLISFKIVNGYYDTGTPKIQTIDVVDKYHNKSIIHNTESFHLRISTENNPNNKIKIDVDKYAYERARIEQKSLILTTKPGALGYEWIVDVTPISVPRMFPSMSSP